MDRPNWYHRQGLGLGEAALFEPVDGFVSILNSRRPTGQRQSWGEAKEEDATAFLAQASGSSLRLSSLA